MDKRFRVALVLLGAAVAVALVWRPATHRSDPVAFATARPAASARPAAVVVYVAGAVRAPGVYSVPAGSRAITAVRAAGGATGEAEMTGVNLAEQLEDGQEVLVPDRSSLESSAPRRARGARGAHAGGLHPRTHGRHRGKRRRAIAPDPGAAVAQPVEPVDLNRADSHTLSAIPGIGDALADRIVTFRDLNGPFGGLTDLLDVGGMSQSRLDRAASYLRVSATHTNDVP